MQSLGDIALAIPDEVFGRIPERYSVGQTHRRLARLARGERRDQHLQAARAAWEAIQRPDLIAELDHEFPPARQD